MTTNTNRRAGDPAARNTDLADGSIISKVSATRPKVQGGSRHRRKGGRVEREAVDRHKALGVHAERYPLSGSSRFRGSGHDLDIYLFGQNEAPLVAEVKARKDGGGFATLERWLGEYDLLFLRRNNADPLIVLPWRIWARLIEQVRP
jgi:Holliday junction resolvase